MSIEEGRDGVSVKDAILSDNVADILKSRVFSHFDWSQPIIDLRTMVRSAYANLPVNGENSDFKTRMTSIVNQSCRKPEIYGYSCIDLWLHFNAPYDQLSNRETKYYPYMAKLLEGLAAKHPISEL